MGTPVACTYAMLTFGQYENATILNEFKSNLLYYRRYIDNVIDLWLPPEQHNTEHWNQFKERLNGWGHLKWKIEDPSKQTVFLDLELKIHNTSFITKTYQKDMNLYLYIPPLSAHPSSCFKGLLTGKTHHYWLQESPSDFQNILCKFIEHLLQTGHDISNIPAIMEQAALTLVPPNRNINKSTENNEDVLYIHRTYHPNRLQRPEIRNLYQKILEPYLEYNRMVIAISRPTKLRDVLTRAKLTPPANISTLIENLRAT
jgi:hypothetical protein